MKKHLSTVIFFVAVIIIWQILYELRVFPAIGFPSVPQIGEALISDLMTGGLLVSAGNSLWMILQGLIIGVVLSFILCALSISFRHIHTIYNTLIATFDTLPGIALMPLLIMWFKSFDIVIIVLMVHGVMWPMSRSILDGYGSTPKIYTEIGENIGLNRWGLIGGVYLPSSLPFIISGLKTGWARAWRALISAEMIFGATSGGITGIGFFIHMRRYQLDSASLIAALLVILLIGILVEYGIFAQIEKRTVRKWGMVR